MDTTNVGTLPDVVAGTAGPIVLTPEGVTALNGHRGERAEQVQAEHDGALRLERTPEQVTGNHDPDHQGVHGKACGAGHQRRAHHGGDPILGRRQGPGGHDPRDRAGHREM